MFTDRGNDIAKQTPCGHDTSLQTRQATLRKSLSAARHASTTSEGIEADPEAADAGADACGHRPDSYQVGMAA